MIIAVDGPAASGKGTLARALARHYGFHYLDTGALYRAVGLSVLAAGADPADPVAAEKAARALDPGHLSDDIALRSRAAGEAASKVAAIPAVRAHILEFQRNFAKQRPGAVLDGRDIGTVVCPEARVKLYVTASPEVRAERRLKELLKNGEAADFDKLLTEIKARDARDMSRAIAPLRPADDAHLLDTSSLDIETAFQAARRIVDGR